MYKLLIIEDDSGIAEAVKMQAEKWDFEVECVSDFLNIMNHFEKFQPHLVLIDIGLPFFNGFYWCSQIRSVSKAPIIFISSASDNMNIVMAMNMGADDFIAKPFDGNVLMAKIQALLRRAYDFAPTVTVLEHRGAKLNTSDGVLTYNDEKIPLTKNEYRILLTLMSNKGKVISREALIKALWETDCFIEENTLTVNVGRLRKKLENAGLDEFIETKFGLGYLIK